MIGFNQGNKVLVTEGNLGMYAKNQEVFTMVNGKYKLLVPTGQFFAMDSKTLLSVDATTTSFPNPIRIGVAQKNGKPRWLSGENFFPSNLEAITAKSPVCGSPDVWDMTWGCTQCSEYYSVLLRILDNDTMSWSGYKLGDEVYFADARTNCTAACGDCNPTATCAEVQDALVTSLNEQLQAEEVKAFATKLYANSAVYCFKPTNNLVCNANCAEYAGLTSIDFGTFSLTDFGTLAASATTVDELLGILQQIADTLNLSTDFEGSAYVTGGFLGSNCCVQLHINSALSVAINNGADTPYVPCSTPTNTDLTDKCGIRIIGAPIAAMSACTMVKELGFYARKLQLFATSPSFSDAVITHVSTTHLPQLFGLYVQHQEYEQVIGGQNRNYSASNSILEDGIGVNLDKNSRLIRSLTFAKPGTSYVLFSLEGSYPHSSPTAAHVLNPFPFTADIYIPECDSTTITAVQSFLNVIGNVNNLLDINLAGGVLEAGDNII